MVEAVVHVLLLLARLYNQLRSVDVGVSQLDGEAEDEKLESDG